MRQTILRFLEDRSGATAIEYGMILAVLTLVIVGGVGKAANSIGALWTGNDSKLQQGLNQVN